MTTICHFRQGYLVQASSIKFLGAPNLKFRNSKAPQSNGSVAYNGWGSGTRLRASFGVQGQRHWRGSRGRAPGSSLVLSFLSGKGGVPGHVLIQFSTISTIKYYPSIFYIFFFFKWVHAARHLKVTGAPQVARAPLFADA